MKSFGSSQLNMEYFFDEILIEVFRHLSPQMLKSSRLVCKRWDQLIVNNKNLWKNHQIVFRSKKDFHKFSVIRNMPKDVVMLDDQGFRLEIYEYLHDIHSLKIDLRPCKAYLDPPYFAKIIHSVPHLKILHVSDIIFNEEIQNIKNFQKVKINLTELQCNSELVDIFDCTTLKILNVRWHYSLSKQKKKNVCKFISKQNELEDLTLNQPNDFFEHFKKLKTKQKLKSFTFFSNVNFKDHIAFNKFLEPHKHSLESLKVQIFSFEQSKTQIEEILKYVMRNLSNLKEFEIDTVFKGIKRKIEVLPLQLSTFAGKSIERFGFNDIFYAVDDTKQLIDMLPNMKHLSIKSCICKLVELLDYAAFNPKLESLKVFNFDCVVSAVKFANLKEFSVHTFSQSIQAFCSFISRNSKTLERITIGDATNICLHAVNAINKCENLKTLTVDVYGNNLSLIMQTMYEIVLYDKPLTVIFKCYPSTVIFKLPEDKIFWDEQIEMD
ncbi:uncharacterized protein [Chironomus tepperi]|uniref:uncharacterized protein n=1 Tax=Chironomus tepperi TaxID=113505 RepID=UPI00391F169B